MPQPSTLCQCPHCHFQAKVTAQDVGETARCPRCKTSFVLAPLEGESSDTAPLQLKPLPPKTEEEIDSSGETLYEPLPEPEPAPVPVEEASSPARKNLLVGAVIAFATFALPFPRFVFSYLGTLVHELGHTLTYLAFGYPAIPSFDFVYGGGLTSASERSKPALFLIAISLCLLLWHLRQRKPALWLAGCLVVVAYGIIASTRLHEFLISAMGHGMVLVIAGIFLYRSVREHTQKTPIEGPLYAACGIFLLLSEAGTAWNLRHDADYRELYAMGKGGVLEGDLTILGRELLGGSAADAAFWLLAGCVLTPCLTYLACRYDFSIIDWLKREGNSSP